MTTDNKRLPLEFDSVTKLAIPINSAEEFLISSVRSRNPIHLSRELSAAPFWDEKIDAEVRAGLIHHMWLNPKLYRVGPDGLWVMGALIVGQLNLSSKKSSTFLCILESEIPDGVNLDDASIKNISLVKCKIGEFSACRLKTSGNVIVGGTEFTKSVYFSNAVISGDLHCNQSIFSFTGYNAFNASDMSVGGTFVWFHFEKPFLGTLNLSRAQVDCFHTDTSSCPKHGKLLVDGFTYTRLNRFGSVRDHVHWIECMEPARGDDAGIYHQPWEQARKVYRNEGDTDAVRQINMAYDAAKARFAFDTASVLLKPIIGLRNFLYDRIAGYGHKLFRVIPWMLGCMLLFWLWSAFAYYHGSIVPTSSRIYMNECFLGTKPLNDCPGWETHERVVQLAHAPDPVLHSAPLTLPAGYPAFHSFLYTLDTFIPFADLHQENYWTVTDDGPWGEWMRAIFSVFIGLGGILSAIFAAAMFSLIRKS